MTTDRKTVISGPVTKTGNRITDASGKLVDIEKLKADARKRAEAHRDE